MLKEEKKEDLLETVNHQAIIDYPIITDLKCNYQKILGSSESSTVFEETWNSRTVAVKKTKDSKNIKNEIEVMMTVCPKSGNLVQLLGVVQEGPYYSLVMEYVPGGNLWELLSSEKEISWMQRYQITSDIVRGLYDLHSNEWRHGDVKSFNVLVYGNYRAKLCDYGLSRQSKTNSGELVGTVPWVDPRVFDGVTDKASDIYSFGVVCWEIAGGQFPVLRNILHLHGFPVVRKHCLLILKDIPVKFANLIEACLNPSPEQRPNADRLVKLFPVFLESKNESDKKIITGGPLLEAIEKDEIFIVPNELDGEKSALISIIWNLEKYLVILPKNPNIRSEADAEQLRKLLMDPEFQHPHVIKFFPSIDSVTSRNIIQKLTEKVSGESKDFQPKLALNEWHKNYEMFSQQEQLPEKSLVNEAKAKKRHMESMSICEFIASNRLIETIQNDEKNLLSELKISERHLDQSLAIFRQIAESVLHINSIFGAHGNLNGNNILVSSGKCILIDTDYAIKADKEGLANHFHERNRGAVSYLAPEVALADSSTKIVVNKIDTWGLAVILVQLLARIKTLEIYIFNLSASLPKNKDPLEFLCYSFRICMKRQRSALDPRVLEALSESSLGETIAVLLFESLQVDPFQRFSVVEMMLYLGYSPEQRDQLIIRNLLLAMRCNNLSMVIEFWKFLQNKNDLLMSLEGKYFFDILNALEHCQDVEIIAYTTTALIFSEKFYGLLIKKSDNGLMDCLYQLDCAAYYLECTRYSAAYPIEETMRGFLKKIQQSKIGLTVKKEISEYKNSSSLLNYRGEMGRRCREKRGLEFAIAAGNALYLSDERLIQIIVKENIIDYLRSSTKHSECFKKIITHGIKLFSGPINFLCFVLEKEPEQFKYLLPHIPNLSDREVHQLSDQKETLLKLSIKNKQPTLFILFILCGKDFKNKFNEDKTIEKCFKEVSADCKTNENNIKLIGRLIDLLCSTSSSSSSFFLKKITSTEIEENEIDILPKNYTLYKRILAKYLQDVLLSDLGNSKGNPYVLSPVSGNKDLYQASEILFIVLQALIKLEAPDERLTDKEECFNCLKWLESFTLQFPDSPFIQKINKIYQNHVSFDTDAVRRAEAESVAKELLEHINKREVEKVKTILKKVQCYSPNPVLFRNEVDQMTPQDRLVEEIFTKQAKWCNDKELKQLLKTSVGLQDYKDVYHRYKFDRIECEILYARVRRRYTKISAQRGSADEFFLYLQRMEIICPLERITRCRDYNQGFYAMMKECEFKKVKSFIDNGMKNWKEFGQNFMNSFNEHFEIKTLLSKYPLQEKEKELKEWVTQMRDCVYDVVAMSTKLYVFNDFKYYAKLIPIPQELHEMKAHLRSFTYCRPGIDIPLLGAGQIFLA